MSDKSPHGNSAKKPGKSIKEKRAEKHARAEAKSGVEELLPPNAKRR
ncbi:MAG: hypothetical protein Q4P07_12915 [Ornithinimicrobium sp.]|nr:hypothetical protein [Ornithinimicrobium sp.]MDO5741036.1 hypothetical protein [Ornithinimicrobium sp.]